MFVFVFVFWLIDEDFVDMDIFFAIVAPQTSRLVCGGWLMMMMRCFGFEIFIDWFFDWLIHSIHLVIR